jgi:hypothetical protein
MAGETDCSLHIADEPVVDKNKSASGAEGDVLVVSSSSNAAVVKMVDKTIPEMSGYWKKSMIIEADRLTYHSTDWLSDGLETLLPNMDIPTVDGSTVVCFKSHLIARLRLPPNKFLIIVMNFLGCELVHLNPNAIAALSCFTMLHECWLGITPGTSLF